MNKYKLDLNDTINADGYKLYRIIALKKIGNIKEGTKGGYIDNENTLSQKNTCWIDYHSYAYKSCIKNKVIIKNSLIINSIIENNCKISYSSIKNSKLYDYAHVDNSVINNCVIIGTGSIINSNIDSFNPNSEHWIKLKEDSLINGFIRNYYDIVKIHGSISIYKTKNSYSINIDSKNYENPLNIINVVSFIKNCNRSKIEFKEIICNAMDLGYIKPYLSNAYMLLYKIINLFKKKK